jgi:hypothetical protein
MYALQRLSAILVTISTDGRVATSDFRMVAGDRRLPTGDQRPFKLF